MHLCMHGCLHKCTFCRFTDSWQRHPAHLPGCALPWQRDLPIGYCPVFECHVAPNGCSNFHAEPLFSTRHRRLGLETRGFSRRTGRYRWERAGTDALRLQEWGGIGRSTVSTGKPGHRTPTGVFTNSGKRSSSSLKPLSRRSDALHGTGDLGAELLCMRANCQAIQHRMDAYVCRWISPRSSTQ
jgi:hypothetical protein